MVTKYPPISRRKPSVISVRFLSETERIIIADLLHSRRSVRAIAMELGRSPSTVS
ncbi:helix-turn-helix domain-containing protein [Arthrobacter sp. Sr33]|uniref:helix-turn-helix domain-containing protein n=1 Tax=Arthrobacter sp. TB 23 TaxID=494419 RepID=UPI003FCDC9B0